jgi:hypothetical protein
MIGLKNVPELRLVQIRALLVLHAADAFVSKKILSDIVLIQKSQDIEQGGFSGTGWSHQCNKFSFLNAQIDSFQEKYPLKARFDVFVKFFEVDHLGLKDFKIERLEDFLSSRINVVKWQG